MHRIKELTFLYILLLQLILSAQELPLLLDISPSPYLNGVAGTGTALQTTDAFAFFYNPAQLGNLSNQANFSLHFYPEKVSMFSDGKPDYRATAVSLGYQFSGQSAKNALSLGIGYLDGELNGGEIVYRDSSGTEIGRALNLEFYDLFAIGLGFEYFFKINVGFTYKRISSNRGLDILSDARLIRVQQEYTAFDYGLLLILPMRRILPQEWMNHIKEMTIRPNASFSFGYALRNFGDEIDFNLQTPNEPLPRSASLGYSLNAGLETSWRNIRFNLVKLNWSVQADDPLVKREGDSFSYQSIIGDINVGRNVISATGDKNVISRKGLSLELVDFFHYTWGWYSGGPYSQKNVNGFGFRTKAIFKFLKRPYQRSYLDFIYDHVDIAYNKSTYYIDNKFKTDYHGISIVISGW
jgi:hypothetical protein